MRGVRYGARVPILGLALKYVQVSHRNIKVASNNPGYAAPLFAPQNVANARFWEIMMPLKGRNRTVPLANARLHVLWMRELTHA